MSRRKDGTFHGTRHDKVCVRCDAPFRTLKQDAKYCGFRCVNLARYDRVGRVDRTPAPSSRVWIIDCDLCRATFVTRSQQTTLCAPCKAAPKRTRIFITDCGVCDRTFVTRYTVSTCSDVCAKAKRRDDRRAGKGKRRAVKKNAFVQNVSPRKVYAADGYRCHICGKKTDPTKQVPHPKAPTIDHVIPLARGGTHEPANCRTAHFICNTRKSDKGGGEQLLLMA